MSNNQEFRKLASLLPPTPKLRDGKIQGFRKTVTGADLLKSNPLATSKDKDGNIVKVDRKRKYSILIPYNEDHFMNIKQAFRTGGLDAVNEYIDGCFHRINKPNPGIRMTVKTKDHEITTG